MASWGACSADVQLADTQLQLEILVNVAGVLTAISALVVSLLSDKKRRRDRSDHLARLRALERRSAPTSPKKKPAKSEHSSEN